MKKPSLPFRISLPAAAMALSALVIGAGVGYLVGSRARTIDWSATGAFLQGLAALLAAAVAAWGVNRWQQELRFKRNSELAEKVMVCTEALRDAMARARSAPNEYEMFEGVGEPLVLSENSYRLRSALLEHKEYAAELRTHVHRVGVLFGTPYRYSLEHILQLHDCLRRALSAATVKSTKLARTLYDPDLVAFELKMLAPTLFKPVDPFEEDDFGNEVDQAFDQLRRHFRNDL